MEKEYSIEATYRFFSLYKELEQLESDEPKKYNYLNENFKGKLDMFRHIRNNIAHNVINEKLPIIVSIDVLNALEELLLKVKTKTVYYAIKRKNIVLVNSKNTISEVIKLMSDNNFSHLPILNSRGAVIGVISETIIINLINKYKDNNILDKTVGEIFKFCSLENEREFYVFTSEDSYLYELNDRIKRKNKQKLGMVFITKNGMANGRLIGMLRTWDILRSQQ